MILFLLRTDSPETIGAVQGLATALVASEIPVAIGDGIVEDATYGDDRILRLPLDDAAEFAAMNEVDAVVDVGEGRGSHLADFGDVPLLTWGPGADIDPELPVTRHLAQSAYQRDLWLAKGVAPEKIAVLPPGLDAYAPTRVPVEGRVVTSGRPGCGLHHWLDLIDHPCVSRLVVIGGGAEAYAEAYRHHSHNVGERARKILALLRHPKVVLRPHDDRQCMLGGAAVYMDPYDAEAPYDMTGTTILAALQSRVPVVTAAVAPFQRAFGAYQGMGLTLLPDPVYGIQPWRDFLDAGVFPSVPDQIAAKLQAEYAWSEVAQDWVSFLGAL